jgi:hypothetical protein
MQACPGGGLKQGAGTTKMLEDATTKSSLANTPN